MLCKGIVLTLCTSVAIDATGVHAPYGFVACGVQIIACIVLLCWDMVSTEAKMASYCKSPWRCQPYPPSVILSDTDCKQTWREQRT